MAMKRYAWWFGGVVFVVIYTALAMRCANRGIDAHLTAGKAILADGYAEQIIHDAKTKGRYVVLNFRAGNEPDSSTASLAIARRIFADRARFASVNIAAERNAELVRKFQVDRPSTTLVAAPNGAITGSFVGPVTAEQLAETFVSPSTADVLHAIQQQETVFLVFRSSATKDADAVIKTAQTVVKELEGVASVVVVNADDKRERSLVANCGLQPLLAQTATFVISPSGGIVESLHGEVTARRLLDSFTKVLSQSSGCGGQTATGGSTCSPGSGVNGKGNCN